MSDFNIQFEEQDQSITLEFEQIGGGAVKSVNGKVGEVVLGASDVGALPSSTSIPTVDATLSVAGAAADAKKTGDEITSLKEDSSLLDDRVTALEEGGSGSGLTEDIKAAMLQIASKVAYIDEHGQDYYDALYDALYPPAPPATLLSIDAVYVQSGTVYTSASLDSLKPDLTVTAHYDDSSSQVINNYTLSGTLVSGTNTITVSYGGKTDTFTVTATEWSTQPVLTHENVTWDTSPTGNVDGLYTKEGFGVSTYSYAFDEDTLHNCQYYDATNDYMTMNGWCGIKSYIADTNTVSEGYTWPSGAHAPRHVGIKNSAMVSSSSFSRNTLANWQFTRQNSASLHLDAVSFSMASLDLDDSYAFWYKPYEWSVLPIGVSDGDVIFAGRNTPYYGKHNISEAVQS